MEGPSQTDIRCEERGSGSAIVEYTVMITVDDRSTVTRQIDIQPALPGVYSVSILAGDEHIKDSPFVLLVDPHNAHLRYGRLVSITDSFEYGSSWNPPCRPSAVRVSGIDERGIYVLGRPIEFEIDTTHAGGTVVSQRLSIDY